MSGERSRLARLRRGSTSMAAAPVPAVAPLRRQVTDAEGRPTTIVLYPEPDVAQVEQLAQAWDLHPLLAEDLDHPRQRPKVERSGDVTFVVMRSAWYIDETEDVELAEFHVVVRPGEIAVLCQDARWIDGERAVDGGLEAWAEDLLEDQEVARLGAGAIAYRLLDLVVDGYGPVLRGLATDQEQIERQVFSGDAAAAERIYRLSREVIDLKHATVSMREVVEALQQDAAESVQRTAEEHADLRAYLGDVSDHLVRADARVTELRDALTQILDVNATLVANRQNEDMKKISGWAAILFSPSLIAAIYGMNFDVMPELHWAVGYPLALAAMATFAIVLYRLFKRRHWL